MGIARHFAFDSAQTEALGGIEAGRLYASIIHQQRFGGAALQEYLAIIGTISCCAQHGQRLLGVKDRIEGTEVGVAHIWSFFIVMLRCSGAQRNVSLIQINKRRRVAPVLLVLHATIWFYEYKAQRYSVAYNRSCGQGHGNRHKAGHKNGNT
jgi:hypothetical protein